MALTNQNDTGEPPNPVPLTMSPAQAAELIGCTEAFLRKRAREYKIPHTRVGKNAIRFSRADIDGTLQALQKQPNTPPRRRAA